jgi:hypothetical protein
MAWTMGVVLVTGVIVSKVDKKQSEYGVVRDIYRFRRPTSVSAFRVSFTLCSADMHEAMAGLYRGALGLCKGFNKWPFATLGRTAGAAT